MTELDHSIVAESIEGWRIWRVIQPEDVTLDKNTIDQLAAAFDRGENPFRQLLAPELRAVAQTATWKPGVTTARCMTNTHLSAWSSALLASYAAPPKVPKRHDAPNVDCCCGIWILKNQEDVWQTLAEYHDYAPLAYGRVRAWGRLIEHERGYRAEHAQPLEVNAIGAPDTLATRLGEAYGIDVRTVEEPALVREIQKQREREQQEQFNKEMARQAELMKQMTAKHMQAHADMLSMLPGIKKRRGFFR